MKTVNREWPEAGVDREILIEEQSEWFWAVPEYPTEERIEWLEQLDDEEYDAWFCWAKRFNSFERGKELMQFSSEIPKDIVRQVKPPSMWEEKDPQQIEYFDCAISERRYYIIENSDGEAVATRNGSHDGVEYLSTDTTENLESLTGETHHVVESALENNASSMNNAVLFDESENEKYDALWDLNIVSYSDNVLENESVKETFDAIISSDYSNERLQEWEMCEVEYEKSSVRDKLNNAVKTDIDDYYLEYDSLIVVLRNTDYISSKRADISVPAGNEDAVEQCKKLFSEN